MSTENSVLISFFLLHSAAGDIVHCLAYELFVVAEGDRFVSGVDFHPLELAYFLLLWTEGGFVKGEPDEINNLFFDVGPGRILDGLTKTVP